jgi:hypothetical protein
MRLTVRATVPLLHNMKLLCSLLLASLTGCFGVYAEVVATTLPSASVPTGPNMTTTTGATSIGFNVGADFGNTKKRFGLGYTSESISVDGGSAKLAGSDMRLDFNVYNLTEKAKVRIGLGAEFGSGSSTKIGGMDRSSSGGGGAYGGLDFTYFLTWHIGLHAFAGARYMTEQVANGSLAGSGLTFRLTATYQFSDVRPDYEEIVPLDSSLDITGVIEAGAQANNCTTFRRSNPTAGYAYVDVKCSDDRNISYFQVAEGIMLTCHHMTGHECKSINLEILDKAAPKKSEPEAVPAAAPVTPAPAPAPATPPATVAPATDPAAPATPAPATP